MKTDIWDLVIVGGGIIGVMAAHLASRRRQGWKILVLEQSTVASGATRHSLGFDLPYGTTPQVRQLTKISNNIYRRLRHDHPDLPLNRVATYLLAQNDRIPQLKVYFAAAERLPQRIKKQESESVNNFFGGLAIAPDQTLLSLGTCYRGSAAGTAELLMQRRPANIHYWEGVHVDQILPAAAELEVRFSDGRRIRTRRAVLATGPWVTSGPASASARDQGIRVKKIAALVINRAPDANAPALCLLDHGAFLLPQAEHRRWLFSFTSRDWDCRPDVGALVLSAQEREEALSILSQYCPTWVDDCSGARVFCDAYGPGGTHSSAKVPGVADLVIAGAGSGSGFRLAPALALEALERLSDFDGGTASETQQALSTELQFEQESHQ